MRLLNDNEKMMLKNADTKKIQEIKYIKRQGTRDQKKIKENIKKGGTKKRQKDVTRFRISCDK